MHQYCAVRIRIHAYSQCRAIGGIVVIVGLHSRFGLAVVAIVSGLRDRIDGYGAVFGRWFHLYRRAVRHVE